MRVLLLATTTGYQTRAFGEAAERLGVDLVFATDRCDMLEDPWQDQALADSVLRRSGIGRRRFWRPRDGPVRRRDRCRRSADGDCRTGR